MLKSPTATIMKWSRSISRPKTSSSQLHALLQGRHGVAALVQLAGLHVDRAPHPAARAASVGILQHIQLRGHTGEEIGRLGIGVLPPGPVASLRFIPLPHGVAVGEQHRKLRLVRVEGAGEARHHIGAVRIEGDAPEPLGFALGEVAVLGAVEARELGVLIRLDRHRGFQQERLGHRLDRQRLVGVTDTLLAAVPVHPGAPLPITRSSPWRNRAPPGPTGLRLMAHRALHPCEALVDGDVQVDGVDQVGRGGVVAQVDGAWSASDFLVEMCRSRAPRESVRPLCRTGTDLLSHERPPVPARVLSDTVHHHSVCTN